MCECCFLEKLCLSYLNGWSNGKPWEFIFSGHNVCKFVKLYTFAVEEA